MLLRAADPPPFRVLREGAATDIVFVGDHAGNAIPAALGDLGLSEGDRHRHIAWDIGVGALGTAISAALDATFIWQPFSRLVIDCNRDPGSPTSIPEVSDGTRVPGNAGLDDAAREGRRSAIHGPYHGRIAAELAARRARGAPPVFVALHSFTPVMNSERRPWQIGVLHGDGDARLSHALLARVRAEAGIVVGDNEPYSLGSTDHTVPVHAFPAALPYLEIEFRQDLLGDAAGIDLWAGRFARWVTDARAALGA